MLKKQIPPKPAASSLKRDNSEKLEARFRAIFENSRDAIGVSKAGVHVFSNPAYLELFGFPAGADLAGKPVLDLIAPGGRDQIKDYIARRARGESVPSAYETRGLRTDGAEFDMEVNVSMYKENGQDHTLVILRDITQRKRAQEEIAERGAMLQQIMDTASVGIGMVDNAGRIIHANQRMAEMFSRPMAELNGCEYVELVHPSEREIGRRNMQALLESEVPSVDLERRYVRKDGTEFWGHLAGNRFYDARGNKLGIIGVITDITERRRAEEALRESETRTRSIIESIPVGMHIYLLEAGGRLVFTGANSAADKILGVDNGIFIGETIEEAFPPLKETEVPQRYSEVAATGKTWHTESLEYHEGAVNGTFKVYAFQTAPNNMVAAFEDITGRKQSELALKESENRYRQLFESESDAIFLIENETGHILTANNAAFALYGYSKEELLALKNTDLSAEPSETHRVTEETPVIKENTLTIPLRYHRKKDGTIFPVEITGRFFNYEGRPVHIAAIRDITERKRAEEALRENERKYRALFEAANDGIFIQDATGFIDCNQKGAEMYGLSKEQIIGRSPADFAPERQPDGRLSSEVAGEKIEAALKGFPQVFEWQPLRADGSPFDVEITLSRLELGGSVCLQAIVRDITGRKRLEQELLKSQKLESLGTLAGGIAHDFNNLLQGVFGYISMAKLTFDQKEKSLDMLEQAEKALHQSVNLTSQLLTFSKGGKPIKNVIALGPVIENAVKFALSGSSVTAGLAIADDLRAVEADEGQIGQVIQNIVLNADQAMPLGGRIDITARNVPAFPAAAGDLVEITISDQGTGIPLEHLPRVFDPYFTTKEKGSGLGLATSYSIIKNHDGEISVASELGKGTTFTIRLPASERTAKTPRPPDSKVRSRHGRVLLMDDEEMVRRVAGEMLRKLGHEVEFAEHGEAAIEKYRCAAEAGSPFDIVILDLTIRGGMGGLETVRKLLDIDRDLKAVVSSGYSADVTLSNYREQGFSAFLKKPYNMNELQTTLKALLR